MIKFAYQSRGYLLNASTDSDWAGDQRTRTSTSGGIVCLGDHSLRSWGSTQTTIALSSREAEYYGLVKAASISMGIRALLADLGVRARIRIMTNASAGQAIAARKRLGEVRHIETAMLWVQEKVHDKTLELVKIKGTFNPADLFTKHLNRSECDKCMSLMNHCFMKGRSAAAPALAQLIEGDKEKEDLLQRSNEDALRRQQEKGGSATEGFLRKSTTPGGAVGVLQGKGAATPGGTVGVLQENVLQQQQFYFLQILKNQNQEDEENQGDEDFDENQEDEYFEENLSEEENPRRQENQEWLQILKFVEKLMEK